MTEGSWICQLSVYFAVRRDSSVNGRYGIDYPIEKYRDYLNEAHIRLRNKIVQCVQDKKQVVIDSSFWSRPERNEYKQLIENAGGQWALIYLKVHPDELRRRLKARSVDLMPMPPLQLLRNY